MNVAEMIKDRQSEIETEIQRLADEQRRLSDALKIIDVPQPANTPAPEVAAVTETKEALIRDAVKRGNRKPATIHQFIRKRHGIDVNIGSLRSTLSRLKNDGVIKHDASGWIVAH